MGPLRVVYNVTSNIRPYADSSSSSDISESGPSLESGPDVNLNPQQSGQATFTSPIWRYVPRPFDKAGKAIGKWAKGPVPPRPWVITPFFAKVQMGPLRLLDRFCPKRKHRILLLAAFSFCWLLVFATVLHQSAASADIAGYGTPLPIDCTSTFWLYKNECGIDGNDCRPFINSSLAFRCPGSCISTEVLNPHAVGADEAIYQPLVIGGPKNGSKSVGDATYRGDSFICSAAIHSGFIPNQQGGCGVLSLSGRGVDYPSVLQHGIRSIGFNSDFPMSFRFLEGSRAGCVDLQWPLLAVTVIFGVILSLFTNSPSVFFVATFISIFWHVALVSDPPSNSDYFTLTSIALGRFLPASFVAYVIYKFSVSKTLNGLSAQVEKTVLWLGGCWVGAMDNFTFDNIPLERLTPHDLQQQPGAIVALTVVILVLLVIVVGQVWAFRVAGSLPRYLAVYGIMAFFLLMFIAVPEMNLRIHHYILALLLLPGTALQTRPSLLYQGILVGLFVNGIARWNFSSLLQTAEELQADATLGTALPHIAKPIIGASNITFDWSFIPAAYDGISVLVNDVERFRKYGNHTTKFTWSRQLQGHPQYFRFGYMTGSSADDYTKAGIWNADGTWTKAMSGPS